MAENSQILVFELAGQHFALPAGDVQELLGAVAITPWPRNVALEGVIDLRGDVLPVLDLRRALGLPAKPVELADHLLIVRTSDRVFAVRVDRAIALAEFETSARRKGAAHAVRGSAEILRPVQSSAGLALLLDSSRLAPEGVA